MLSQFIDEGYLPNFQHLATTGDFAPLETTMPPLSPVAWSTFITGLDPGGHGIYDFLHRDPATLEPYDSIYQVAPPGRSIALGSWVIPLTGGEMEPQRKGRVFWELLEEAGVDTTVFRMPVNFPPVESSGHSFSGMGTPDILGTHGTFSYYTDYPPDNANNMTGGAVYLVEVISNRVAGQLVGPANTFRRFPADRTGGGGRRPEIEYENPDLTVDFEVFLDPEAPAAKLVVQEQEFVLNEGEWSDWVSVDFEAVPFLVNVSAMGRFYLQEVRPDFKLYVTPLQIDPVDPALPVSTPDGWARELSRATWSLLHSGAARGHKGIPGGNLLGSRILGAVTVRLPGTSASIGLHARVVPGGVAVLLFLECRPGQPHALPLHGRHPPPVRG